MVPVCELPLQGNDSSNLLRLAVKRNHLFAGPYFPFCGDTHIFGGSGKPGGKGSSFEQFCQFIHSGHRSDELEHIGTGPGVEFIEFSLQTKEGWVFQENFLSGLQESFLSKRHNGKDNLTKNGNLKEGSPDGHLYHALLKKATFSTGGDKMIRRF